MSLMVPDGSVITLSGLFNSIELVANIAVTGVKYKPMRINFQRVEFQHSRLLEAKNVDGSKPVVNILIGNRPVQYFSNCNVNETARPLTPDDTDIDNIFQAFHVKHYEITGGICLASDIDTIYTMSQDHQTRIGRFEAHQDIARDDVSYDFLVDILQPETFAFITTTGLTMQGRSLGAYSPENQMLIVDFNPDVLAATPYGGSTTIYRTFSMIIENRTIFPARSNVW